MFVSSVSSYSPLALRVTRFSGALRPRDYIEIRRSISLFLKLNPTVTNPVKLRDEMLKAWEVSQLLSDAGLDKDDAFLMGLYDAVKNLPCMLDESKDVRTIGEVLDIVEDAIRVPGQTGSMFWS